LALCQEQTWPYSIPSSASASSEVYGVVVYKINLEGLWRFTFAERWALPLGTVMDRVPEFIRTVLPGDQKYELTFHTAYNIHQRSAATYRVGHVLLGSDAAHLTDPTSGFGLMGGLVRAQRGARGDR
jgi:3-(3-hydroxy-phenyl)propionate hydroxylase/6-hydroxy-3-succinoylpyridine 3-monooxygenase